MGPIWLLRIGSRSGLASERSPGLLRISANDTRENNILNVPCASATYAYLLRDQLLPTGV